MCMCFCMYRSATKKKLFFFAFTPRTKILKRELSRSRFHISSCRAFFLREFSRRNSTKLRGVTLRNFAQIFRESWRRHLRNVYRETFLNFNYLLVNYSVIWRMIANSELKVSRHIDRSQFFHSAFASIYTYISFSWWGFGLFDVQCELKTMCHVVKLDLE